MALTAVGKCRIILNRPAEVESIEKQLNDRKVEYIKYEYPNGNFYYFIPYSEVEKLPFDNDLGDYYFPLNEHSGWGLGTAYKGDIDDDELRRVN